MLSLADKVQHVTGESVTLACVDQGYTRQKPAQAAEQERMQLHVIMRKEAKKYVVLHPRHLGIGGYLAEFWLSQALSTIGKGLCAMTANHGRAAIVSSSPSSCYTMPLPFFIVHNTLLWLGFYSLV